MYKWLKVYGRMWIGYLNAMVYHIVKENWACKDFDTFRGPEPILHGNQGIAIYVYKAQCGVLIHIYIKERVNQTS